MRVLCVVLGVLMAIAPGCGSSGPSGDDLVFDPCQPFVLDAPGASGDQQGSLDDAAAMWRDRGSMPSDGPLADAVHIPVRFEEGAAVFHGYYDGADGVILINNELDDRRQRAITIAHELGHAFGLAHVASQERSSVMKPANLTIAPTEGDQLAIESLWGVCVPPANQR